MIPPNSREGGFSDFLYKLILQPFHLERKLTLPFLGLLRYSSWLGIDQVYISIPEVMVRSTIERILKLGCFLDNILRGFFPARSSCGHRDWRASVPRPPG